MKMRVIRAFGVYSVGAIIEPTGVYRQNLQVRGFIEPVKEIVEAEPVLERAVQPVETAVAAVERPIRRQRKRATD